METSGNVEPTATQKLPGISASMQTEASWLHEHAHTLSEEFSSLDILCDMEFKEDFVKLFKNSLRTLPSVGLPTLLAYRPESSRGNIQIETEEDCAPRCEYCGSLLKLFPSFEDACPPSQDYESKFCCEHNRDLYEFIVNERKNHEGTWNVPIAVSPHESHSTEADRLLSKERAYQRQQERQMARQLAFLGAEPTSVAECSNQAGTISYLLSQEPPSPKGRTLVPGERAAKPEEEPVSYSITCCDFTPVGGKVVKNELLEKHYKHGGKFLTVLPDGTSQLLINMNIQGGQYLDQEGSRVRRWTWPNSVTSSGPHIPLGPIFISLNRHIGVRILGQDKITVSFLAMGQQAKFNVGTKVQVNNIGQLPPPTWLGEDELLLLAFRVRILRLFDRLRRCLSFPSNEQWDKIKPPAYLTTQTLKILQLCTTSDISDELRSSIRAIVNAQV